MKRVTAVIGWLFIVLIIHACSKNVTPVPDPVPPVDSTGDSTNVPDDGNGDDDDNGEDIAPVTKNYEFYKLPILDAGVRSSLYLGAITTKTDREGLIHPVITEVGNSYRNPVTIYTDVSMDDFVLKDVMASKTTDNKLISSIQKVFEGGIGQVPSVSVSSPIPFVNRLNSLRSMIGINEDLNGLLDLGFPDTTRLADDKGRVILSFEIVKANIMTEPPIYAPFMTIDSTDEKWAELFGSAKSPEMVSSITYGENAVMVIESDSSAEKLRLAVDKYLKKPVEDILSGAAFNSLSEEEQRIMASATAYGYAVGRGAFPHEGRAAIDHYAELREAAADNHDMGRPIYYRMSKLTSFATFINNFDVDVYPQKIRP